MNSVSNLLPILKKDFPDIHFVPGETFYWSSRENKITYTTHQSNVEHGIWALFHELAHAILKHEHYDNDFELLKIESNAWKQAKILAKKYGININSEHIQDCLDTYRDWLHGRAKCPICGVVSLQKPDGFYQCFNCKTAWKVPKSQLHKTTRKIIK